jgi:hypothetical protein
MPAWKYISQVGAFIVLGGRLISTLAALNATTFSVEIIPMSYYELPIGWNIQANLR